MSKLRMEGEALATVVSNCGSPVSSWMSDLSMASEADQSLHSFSQSQSQQGEALAEPEPNSNPSSGGEGCSSSRGRLEGDATASESGSDKGTTTKDKLRRLPPSMAKTNIQILAGPGSISPLKMGVHPCATVKPMILQESAVLASPTKSNLAKDSGKYSAPLLASISSEMSFEDPWLKRKMDNGRSRELVCEVKPEKREGAYSKSNAGSGDLRSFCKDGKKVKPLIAARLHGLV